MADPAPLLVDIDVPQRDPNIADLERRMVAARLASPLRPIATHGRHSADTVGLPLFEPTLL